MKAGLYFLFFPFLMFSCVEHDLNIQKTNFPSKRGSYWIYRIVTTSADELVSIFPYEDSVWVQGDTTINDKHYLVQRSTLNGTTFLRDSADCVLWRQLTYEQIIYSTSRDTLFRFPPITTVMTDIGVTTHVPAGDFVTMNCRTLVRKTAGAGHGSDLPSYNSKFYTSDQFICSHKVGLIKRIDYYLGGTIEYELVRFKLN